MRFDQGNFQPEQRTAPGSGQPGGAAPDYDGIMGKFHMEPQIWKRQCNEMVLHGEWFYAKRLSRQAIWRICGAHA